MKQRYAKKPLQLAITEQAASIQDSEPTIMAVQTPTQIPKGISSKDYPRTVAMISIDVKSHEGDWYNNMTTLVDSCGCENGINSSFARLHGFQIQTEKEDGPSAVSACGEIIAFKEFVVVQLKIKDIYIWEKFYLMENLPRNLLLGFPWFQKNGAILDARKGYLKITDLDQLVPLIRLKKQQPEETVFATFGLQCSNLLSFQPTVPVPLQFEKAIFKADPYGQILKAETDLSENAKEIQNVFAATLPRKRTNSIDLNIQKLQQNRYEDNKDDESYQQQLQDLIIEYEDIFDTESTQPANVPEIHIDLKPEHLIALEQLFLRMRKLNIKCRREKCIFMVNSIRTMGFVVQHEMIKPDPQKLDMLKKMPEPNNKQQLKAYLGLLQFYRDMLPHLAHTAYQLYAATSENYTFQWTKELSKYFNLTKSMLEKEILNTNLQGNENIKMYVDASKSAVCAVVTQNGKIVACTSKVLNPSQKRWSTVERELYALSWGLKKMRFYLHGVYFEVFSDHKPLLGLVNKEAEPPNNRIATMLLSISEYTFLLKYLPGARNVIADFGTRNLDTSEWDKAGEDDEEGLHELFLCPILQEKTKQLEEFHNEENMTEKDYSEIGKFSYEITSHLKRETTLKININDMKMLHLPETSEWKLNEKYFQAAITEMGSMVKHRKVYYDLKHIGAMVSDILAKRSINIQFFIIPDWPCMEWYAILHSEILAEAIKLPKVEDLFLDKLNKPIGNFAWDHWLFELR